MKITDHWTGKYKCKKFQRGKRKGITADLPIEIKSGYLSTAHRVGIINRVHNEFLYDLVYHPLSFEGVRMEAIVEQVIVGVPESLLSFTIHSITYLWSGGTNTDI